jgi:hypothetical protein
MPTHGAVAKSARNSKERNPQYYCANPRCLFRTFNGQTGEVTPCPKHAVTYFPRKDQ